MEDKVKSLTKDVSQLLNNYVDSKDINKIKEIEECFKKFFSANTVQFWRYDDRSDELQILGDKESPLMPLDSSITKQAISMKSPIIVNHITSDKYYNQSIDNPLELKVKALLLFPIMKEKKVLGVMRIWRGIKQRKVFTKQDEKSLEFFSSVLVNIIQLKGIDKKELISLIGTETSSVNTNPSLRTTPVKKAPVKKAPARSEVRKPKKKTSENDAELETLKKSIADYKFEVSKYKKELKSYEEDKSNKENYDELEASALEFSTLISEYQTTDKEQKSKIEMLIQENKSLKAELKDERNNSKTKSIKELKAEKNIENDKQLFVDPKNMESILHYIASYLIDYEHTYILFEFILYSLHSKQGKSEIEEILRKSKMTSTVIDQYYFQGGMKLYKEKYLISELSNNIREYSHSIFSKETIIDINISEDLAPSLVIDASKIQSIAYHLLIDLYQLLDNTKPVNIDFSYSNKSLVIELGGSIHQQNSLLKSMFKQTKLGGNEKDRIGLRLCQNITKIMNGKLEFVHDKTKYKFVLSLPSKKIKM